MYVSDDTHTLYMEKTKCFMLLGLQPSLQTETVKEAQALPFYFTITSQNQVDCTVLAEA